MHQRRRRLTILPSIVASPPRVRRRAHRMARLLVLLASLAACGEERPPFSPGAPVPLQRLTIEGPAEVPPGTTVQFRAVQAGTSGEPGNDWTEDVVWSSSNQSVLSLDGGLATGRAAGETNIIAQLGTQRVGKQVFVLPPGTHRVKGSVQVEGLNDRIVGANVEVREVGITATTTGSFFGFVLYGVPSNAEYNVSAQGFEPLAQRQTVSGHDTALTFFMRPLGPTPDASGTYQLTVDAGPCIGPGAIPPELAHRAYAAVVTQSGMSLTVKLSGAVFEPSSDARWGSSRGDTFFGVINALGSRFSLRDPGFDDEGPLLHPDVVERLPDGRFFMLAGEAITTYSSSGFSGRLDGSFSVRSQNVFTTPSSYCYSSAHLFTLRR